MSYHDYQVHPCISIEIDGTRLTEILTSRELDAGFEPDYWALYGIQGNGTAVRIPEEFSSRELAQKRKDQWNAE